MSACSSELSAAKAKVFAKFSSAAKSASKLRTVIAISDWAMSSPSQSGGSQSPDRNPHPRTWQKVEGNPWRAKSKARAWSWQKFYTGQIKDMAQRTMTHYVCMTDWWPNIAGKMWFDTSKTLLDVSWLVSWMSDVRHTHATQKKAGTKKQQRGEWREKNKKEKDRREENQIRGEKRELTGEKREEIVKQGKGNKKRKQKRNKG